MFWTILLILAVVLAVVFLGFSLLRMNDECEEMREENSLDLLGEQWGVERKMGEADTDYRIRMTKFIRGDNLW